MDSKCSLVQESSNITRVDRMCTPLQHAGRLSLGFMSAEQRATSLAWVSKLVAQRFGTLPSSALPCPLPPSSAPPSDAAAGAAEGATTAHAAGTQAAGPAGEAAGPAPAAEEEGASALQVR